MLAMQRERALCLWAPAKVNLFLEVIGRRSDGYHDLMTIMSCVSLYDTLIFRPTGRDNSQTHLRVTDARRRCHPSDPIPLPTSSDENLVGRAVQQVRQVTGVQTGVDIHLIKRIPLQAGLGGGSSDAATTLLALNALWNLGLTRSDLMTMAASLGSDVPFFLQGGSALCEGRGELIQAIPSFPSLPMVIAVPPEGLSTRDVFSDGCIAPGWHSGVVEPWLAPRSPCEIGRSLFNRLQIPASRRCPWIAPLLLLLQTNPVFGASMTGSGSACFAICRTARHAHFLARRLSERNFPSYSVRSLPAHPPPMSAA
jgi:4-diphosphocytidyl-2-C-methyl-D-erythritol kinase